MPKPKQPTVLPGFRLTLGFTLFYLCLIVLVPLLTLPARTATMGWNAIWTTIRESAGDRVVQLVSAPRLLPPRSIDIRLVFAGCCSISV